MYIDNWFTDPCTALQLTVEQRAFIQKHELSISTAYIGLVRIYSPHGVAFSTSAAPVIEKAMQYGKDSTKPLPPQSHDLIDYQSLIEQTHNWLDVLVALSDGTVTKYLECTNKPLLDDDTKAVFDTLKQ
jgi:hypothetical protein